LSVKTRLSIWINSAIWAFYHYWEYKKYSLELFLDIVDDIRYSFEDATIQVLEKIFNLFYKLEKKEGYE